MPLISVIVPVYNVEQYLRRCVDSILGQTFTDFELILIDDGSPDRCGEICDEYAAADFRVKVIHKENGGVSSARNAGLDHIFSYSDSRWISFVDSDDWVHPRFLEYLHDAAVTSRVGISACGCHETADPHYTSEQCDDPETTVYETEDFWIASGTWANVVWNKLYRKELFRDYRFPFGRVHEDDLTIYRVLFSDDTWQVAFITTQLYYYYERQGSIMHSRWNLGRLAVVDAMTQQCDFFRQKQLPKALRFAIRRLFLLTAGAIHKLKEYYPEEKKLIRKYRRKLRAIKMKNMWLDTEPIGGRNTYLKLAHPFCFFILKKIQHLKYQ